MGREAKGVMVSCACIAWCPRCQRNAATSVTKLVTDKHISEKQECIYCGLTLKMVETVIKPKVLPLDGGINGQFNKTGYENIC